MEQQEITPEWLAAQESFQEYCLRPTSEHTTFWKEWMAAHPERTSAVEQAKDMVHQLAVQPGEEEVEAELRRLRANVRLQRSEKQDANFRVIRRRVLQVAAILLVGLAAYWFWPPTSTAPLLQVSTIAGETKEIMLSDGSLVVLNANSSLQYSESWAADAPRELWLEGEAFFEVDHQPDRPFTVHGASGDVVVLGTTFNHSDRKGRLVVTLVEGSVEFVAAGRENVRLRPNEQLTIEQGQQVVSAIDLEVATAWRYNRMVFKETPISQIIQQLEQNFDLRITVRDEAVLQRKVSARIPENKPALLLEALSVLYDLQIEQVGDKAYIIE